MHARERVIRKRFAAHICSNCGQSHHEVGVLILARRHDTWLVMVTCPRCDHRAIFVVSFPSTTDQGNASRQPANPAALQVRALSAESLAAAMTEATTAPAISLDDVTGMRAFLQTFDGNFRRIFAES